MRIYFSYLVVSLLSIWFYELVNLMKKQVFEGNKCKKCDKIMVCPYYQRYLELVKSGLVDCSGYRNGGNLCGFCIYENRNPWCNSAQRDFFIQNMLSNCKDFHPILKTAEKRHCQKELRCQQNTVFSSIKDIKKVLKIGEKR